MALNAAADAPSPPPSDQRNVAFGTEAAARNRTSAPADTFTAGAMVAETVGAVDPGAVTSITNASLAFPKPRSSRSAVAT